MKLEPASGVRGAQRRHHRAGRRILLHRAAGDRQVGRGFVLVGDADVQRLGVAEAAGVGHRHAQLMRGGALVVEAGARLHADLIAHHLELAGGIGGQRIGEARARIRVRGTQRRHHRAGRRILLHRAAGHREVGRGFVLRW